MWGLFAGEARKQPPHIAPTTADPKEPLITHNGRVYGCGKIVFDSVQTKMGNEEMCASQIDIATILRNAHLFNPRRPAVLEEPIAQIVDDLFALLETREVKYLLTGGIALLNYVEGRNTEDIDLIIALPDLRRLGELQISSQDKDFVRATYRGLQVDLLLTRNRLFAHVRKHHATQARFRGKLIPTVSPDGLILLKFYALPSLYRQGEFDRVALYETDLAMLLQKYPMPANNIFPFLSNYLASGDIDSLVRIHQEIEQRIQRFKKGWE
jgi:hypothetical protein